MRSMQTGNLRKLLPGIPRNTINPFLDSRDEDISSTPPPDGVLRMRRQDAGARCFGGGEDKDTQKKAGV